VDVIIYRRGVRVCTASTKNLIKVLIYIICLGLDLIILGVIGD
jgi:hypothetical protein